MATQVGKLEEVTLREVWAHEAVGFSAWLEQNLDVLGNALGRTFTFLERERHVGSFNVDLVAEDERENLVVIENQLEASDHDHLGKVLTYVTNLDAKTAIWIVREGRAEHLRAIQWLNESTPADVAFYLVRMAAYRIGDSAPAPLFTMLVGPSADSKAFGSEKKELAKRHEERLEFWEQLLAKAKEMGVKWHANRTGGTENWLPAGAGKSGLIYSYVIWMDDQAAVELYIDVGDQTENKRIFDTLLQQKQAIEHSFGESLQWERLDDKRACRIRKTLQVPGLHAPQDQWPQAQEQMIRAMDRLVKALKPELARL